MVTKGIIGAIRILEAVTLRAKWIRWLFPIARDSSAPTGASDFDGTSHLASACLLSPGNLMKRSHRKVTRVSLPGGGVRCGSTICGCSPECSSNPSLRMCADGRMVDRHGVKHGPQQHAWRAQSVIRSQRPSAATRRSTAAYRHRNSRDRNPSPPAGSARCTWQRPQHGFAPFSSLARNVAASWCRRRRSPPLRSHHGSSSTRVRSGWATPRPIARNTRVTRRNLSQRAGLSAHTASSATVW